MIRIQFVPLPRMNPFHPSSRHIFTRAFHIDSLYSSLPTLWIWSKIFNRSSGDTIVLETAPATPPAMNAATTGSAILLLTLLKEDEFGGWASYRKYAWDCDTAGAKEMKNQETVTSDIDETCNWETVGGEFLFASSMESFPVVFWRSKLMSTSSSFNPIGWLSA